MSLTINLFRVCLHNVFHAFSANFRVRGPASDDGIRREFVVSTQPNLAIEKDQILVTPVSYEDFVPREHFMKRGKSYETFDDALLGWKR